MPSKRFRIASLLLNKQMKQVFAKQLLPVEQERARLEKFTRMMRPPSDCTITPVMADDVPAEWIEPPKHNGRTLIYLHGGAYCLGSLNTHRSWVSTLAVAAQARTLLIDYRLAPEHPFPAALEDATAVYRWLLRHGHDPARIAIAGDSAGGGLTLATLLNLRDMEMPLPKTAVCISPWTDLAGTGETMQTNQEEEAILTPEFLHYYASLYLSGTPTTHPMASPLYADFYGLPPLLIQVGGREILLDDAQRLAKQALDAGVKVTLDFWPEMIHVWHQMSAVVPESREAINRAGIYLRQQIPDHATASH